jgi:acyl carrier protein
MNSRIVNILADSIGISTDEITPDKNIMDDLGADSLTTVEIVMALEEEFDIEIPDDVTEEMFTVQDIMTYIENL